MKFLVDAQLPPGLALWLREAGHEARAVREVGLRDASDGDICAFPFWSDHNNHFVSKGLSRFRRPLEAYGAIFGLENQAIVFPQNPSAFILGGHPYRASLGRTNDCVAVTQALGLD